MGIQIIKMPDIGEGIAEVELVAWRVKVGDRVMEDQILADVMTDKATVEIPSPVNGTVRTLDGVVGQVIAVGSEIIHIQTDGAQSPTDVAAASVLAAAVVAEKLAPTSSHPVAEIPVTIRQEAATALSGTTATKVLAAPAVRRRAREIGIDLALLAARAPGAQLTHADLDHYLQQAAGSTLPVHRPATSDLGAEQQIAVIGLRRKIAQKMQESNAIFRTSPTSKKSTSANSKPCERSSMPSMAPRVDASPCCHFWCVPWCWQCVSTRK
jgi:2-oxoisovalerate dehydrogenase E2 component (dihydrolipoyl transacylase)